MSGFKTFVSGEILRASDVNEFVMSQQIAVFDSTAARDASIGAPVHGQFAYIKNVATLFFYNGTAWEEF
jgi:hypothetical protein